MSLDIVAAETLTVGDAERLTHRIQLLVGAVSDNMEKLRELVQRAKEGNAHELLGYPSWSAYLLFLFGDEPLRLTREVRQELVQELSEQGMSTRAIAPIVGVTHETVAQDIKAPVRNLTPEPATEAVPDLAVNPQTGEVYEAGDDEPVVVTETHTVKTVTGLDGKTYKTPAQKPVLAGDELARYDAEKNSKSLGDALRVLEGITFPEHRGHILNTWWPDGKASVTPIARDLFTPARLREFAVALTDFANELEETL